LTTDIKESKTSKLGHIRSSKVRINKTLGDNSTAFNAGSTYTHKVYYIKKEARISGQTYYQISKKPSSGIVGWVQAPDMTAHPHTVVDKKDKEFYIKGSGSAYGDAWGGKKDKVYSNLSTYQNQVFKVHLTEKVGSTTW